QHAVDVGDDTLRHVPQVLVSAHAQRRLQVRADPRQGQDDRLRVQVLHTVASRPRGPSRLLVHRHASTVSTTASTCRASNTRSVSPFSSTSVPTNSSISTTSPTRTAGGTTPPDSRRPGPT